MDKLVNSLAPLIGYETIHSTIASPGWSESASKDDISAWEDKGLESMEGWDKEFWQVEREVERKGWMKVSALTSRPYRRLTSWCTSNSLTNFYIALWLENV
jgi:hypothetical protein